MPSAALARHPETRCDALESIEVRVEHASAGMLAIAFTLEGDIGALRIPAPCPPRVADRLWQHTCCEIFLSADPGYREYNFSPSGEWAAYEFRRYREGGPVAASPPGIQVRRSARRLELTAQIAASGSRVGASAVIEAADGTLSYWALRHAPGKPDFHHASAFAMELDEVRH
jgi:hypothetical protein